MSFFSDAFHLFIRSMKKLVRNPILVFFSLFQPIIFLLLFTQLFSNLGRFIGSGTLSYTTFATAGIVLQNAFSSAFQSGTAVVDDIKSGFLAKMLATPVNRSAILFGRILSDAFRVVAQTVIILALAYPLGVFPETGFVGYVLIIFTVNAIRNLIMGCTPDLSNCTIGYDWSTILQAYGVIALIGVVTLGATLYL